MSLAKSIHYRLSLTFSYRLNGERGYARMTRKATKPQTEELQLYKYFFYCFLYISLRIDIFSTLSLYLRSNKVGSTNAIVMSNSFPSHVEHILTHMKDWRAITEGK